MYRLYANIQAADSCGTSYVVLCNTNTSPGASGSAAVTSILACMQACDAFSGCVAATFDGSTCYMKTTYQGTSSSTGTTAIVLARLYVPPSTSSSSTVSGTATTSSASTSTSSQVCTAAPSPSTPACPGDSGNTFVDACGSTFSKLRRALSIASYILVLIWCLQSRLLWL